MANAICNGITNLSYKLYEILSKNEGNILYSSFSLHSVLALAYQGSGGTVASNLEKALTVSGAKKSADGYENLLETLSFLYSVKLYIANKIYAQEGLTIKDDFNALAQKSFFAEAENINLSDKDDATSKINNWVEEKTESRVRDLISPDDLASSPNLILVNSISFKGDWVIQLEDKDTQKKKFYISETETVDCAMMHGGVRVKYGEDLDLESQVLNMAYENEGIYLMIFLPRTRMGYKELETKIQNKPIPKILQNMDLADVLMSLPKFKIETKVDLQKPLTELGLGVLYNNQGEFPNLVDSSDPIKGVKVIQKVNFEVNEQGTDAGEAGFAFGTSQNQRVQYREFNADHPFLFMLIYDEEGNRAPLYSGRVVNPTL